MRTAPGRSTTLEVDAAQRFRCPMPPPAREGESRCGAAAQSRTCRQMAGVVDKAPPPEARGRQPASWAPWPEFATEGTASAAGHRWPSPKKVVFCRAVGNVPAQTGKTAAPCLLVRRPGRAIGRHVRAVSGVDRM